MKKKKSKLVIILIPCFVLLFALPAFAQEAEPPEPTRIEVEAADGLLLVGDLYVPESEFQTPAVLLMHQFNSNRESWSDLIPPLLDAGYAVLTVDLRGHGETGGGRDWTLAQGDVQTWLDWLREQPEIRPDQISIAGASIGSNLALTGCAADPACVTAIALSPGLDYFGVATESAITEGLSTRSALIVTAQGDDESVDSVRHMVSSAAGEISVQIFNSSSHGTNMFHREGEQLTALIVYWLTTHTPQD